MQPQTSPLFQAARRPNSQFRCRRRRDRFSTAEWCRRNDRMGRLIRHARPAAPFAVGALPVPMIEPAFGASLVTAVGRTALLTPGFRAASRAAIPLPPIAVCADPEHRLASLAAANPLPESHFSMSLHPPTQADFDSGNSSCHGRSSFDGDLLTKVAEPEPRCLERRGSLPPSKPQYKLSLECSGMID